MATSAGFQLTMRRGDDRELLIAVDGPVRGVRQDITGWTLWVTAKRAVADADGVAVFRLKTGGQGIALTDPTAGLATAAIPAGATDGLEEETILYVDVQGKDGAGKVRTLASGTIVVVPDITRATV